MPKEKKNLYTVLKGGMKPRQKDAGKFNLYTEMGWKAKKVKEPVYRNSRKATLAPKKK